MFAINHAATALLLKRRFPRAPLGWLLVSVQAMELLWVALHFIGVERTHTEPVVRSVGDIHLAHMPFSHSLAGALVLAAGAWLLVRVGRHRSVALAVAIGVASHFILDLVTHAPDLPLFPGSDTRLGLGLYAAWPVLGFLVELAYSLLVWRVWRGDLALLVAFVGFNLANLTMFLPGVAGLESLLAGRPLAIVGLVAAQIVVTAVVVHRLARRQQRAMGAHDDARDARDLALKPPTRAAIAG